MPAVMPGAARVEAPAKVPRAWVAIGLAGLVAGVLDLLFVIVLLGFRGVGPGRILQGIAAGAVGRQAAINGGVDTMALGLAFHFLIAGSAAVAYYALSRGWRVLLDRPFISGALYGVAVWAFMNLVVLPLSATPPQKFPPPMWMPVLAAHVCCVGWPIALVLRWHERRREAVGARTPAAPPVAPP